jgi:nucleotide-binding universal stress UspA family protein
MTPAARISRVLVGVDFDQASASALKLAGVIASVWDAHVTVLHSAAQEAPAYFTANQIDTLEVERERTRAGLADRLRTFASPHLRGAVDAVVDERPPQDAIVRMAPDFDLIVVGTNRPQGARRWWLGSVAEAVVRRSARPVLVVPADAQVPETHRPVSIVSAGDDREVTEAWIDVLLSTFLGHVVRFPALQKCAPALLQNADLIVLSMPADADAHASLGAIVQVLKDCVHPVLFVPSTSRIFEGSPS